MNRLRLPSWLRRGLEASIFAGGLAVGTLLFGRFNDQGAIVILPAGPTAILALALPVLSLGVLTVAYPIGLAPTRSDALLGAVAGFLIAADLTVLLSTTPVYLPALDAKITLGLLCSALAIPPAVGGLIGGQLASPLGFGRRAGAWSAISAAVVATPVLLLTSQLG